MRHLQFGHHIRAVRIAAGRRQTDLERLLCNVRGVNQSAISRLEHGDWLPDAGQLEHILVALGATEREAQEARRLAAQAALRSPPSEVHPDDHPGPLPPPSGSGERPEVDHDELPGLSAASS